MKQGQWTNTHPHDWDDVEVELSCTPYTGEGTKCAPDIFSTKENVAMQVLQHRPGSYYLSLATTSANRRSNASVPHDTVVKVALLSHQHPPPTQPQTKLALGSANAAAALLVHDKHCCRP
ncbi:hypothetical protein HPB51_008035 [Rhipicephalus microplus]|uniref:Uncharacterized protein n=1 Tax=Rhipicephalus microplus TaxID=6941 RepID=A0A9J6ER43_RHIMP|nr:hypothetical protein HPB51_008035 [Rhipicephalus microplus]